MFTIVGLHVFGGVEVFLPDGTPVKFPNFNTFINSMVSTFMILCLENWDQQLYPLIRSTNWGAAAFFVCWIIIGGWRCVRVMLCARGASIRSRLRESVEDPGREASWGDQPGTGGEVMGGCLQSSCDTKTSRLWSWLFHG